jgi:hypothetical protein
MGSRAFFRRAAHADPADEIIVASPIARPWAQLATLTSRKAANLEAPMDEGSKNLESRLRAVEFLVANLYGIENRRRGWDTDRVTQEHRELLDRMRQSETGVQRAQDPAPRDVYQAMESLLADIRALS